MRIKHKGKYCILRPGSSDLGILTVAEKMNEALQILNNQGHQCICVDLSRTPIVDSSVIGTLVQFHQRMKEGDGELIIISGRNRAIEAMMSMRLERVIRFVESEDDLI